MVIIVSMTEQHLSDIEATSAEADSLSLHFDTLLALDPLPIKHFVPTDTAEQRELFLSGTTENPRHAYGRIETVDFESQYDQIAQVAHSIESSDQLPAKYTEAYTSYADRFEKTLRLIELTQVVRLGDEQSQADAAAEFMNVNIELYGEPDEKVYREIVAERVSALKQKDLSESGSILRHELLGLIGEVGEPTGEKFVPSKETVQWMKGVAESLYGGLLRHVPEVESGGKISAAELSGLFSTIIHSEFESSADGWTVSVEDATSVNVKPTVKDIVIPAGREYTVSQVRGLVVHELGVHLLRSVSGESTDLSPLKTGLNGYYDSEEGLGSVMEQALKGEYKEAGIGHYMTIGGAYFDGRDFRESFEVKWRLGVLDGLKEGEEVTQAKIDKARKAAYTNTLRTFRGTDTLPWFKDLAYYNGVTSMWKHLEEIRGDDLQLSFVLMGKADPANSSHKKLLYETSSL